MLERDLVGVGERFLTGGTDDERCLVEGADDGDADMFETEGLCFAYEGTFLLLSVSLPVEVDEGACIMSPSRPLSQISSYSSDV